MPLARSPAASFDFTPETSGPANRGNVARKRRIENRRAMSVRRRSRCESSVYTTSSQLVRATFATSPDFWLNAQKAVFARFRDPCEKQFDLVERPHRRRLLLALLHSVCGARTSITDRVSRE